MMKELITYGIGPNKETIEHKTCPDPEMAHDGPTLNAGLVHRVTGSFVNFQWIQTSIDKIPYIFVIFWIHTYKIVIIFLPLGHLVKSVLHLKQRFELMDKKIITVLHLKKCTYLDLWY